MRRGGIVSFRCGPAIGAALLAGLGWACDSSHEVYGGDTVEAHDAVDAEDGGGDDGGIDDGVAPEETAGDAEPDEGGAVTEHSCDSAGGVAVEGVVEFGGTVPGPARLYVLWMVDLGTPGIPPCYVEIVPAAFPARFRFTEVPRGETWALAGLLDVDGGAIPIPTTDDYYDGIPSGTLDLSGDVSGVTLVLEPYTAP
jgi:hypothetical protein